MQILVRVSMCRAFAAHELLSRNILPTHKYPWINVKRSFFVKVGSVACISLRFVVKRTVDIRFPAALPSILQPEMRFRRHLCCWLCSQDTLQRPELQFCRSAVVSETYVSHTNDVCWNGNYLKGSEHRKPSVSIVDLSSVIFKQWKHTHTHILPLQRHFLYVTR